MPSTRPPRSSPAFRVDVPWHGLFVLMSACVSWVHRYRVVDVRVDHALEVVGAEFGKRDPLGHFGWIGVCGLVSSMPLFTRPLPWLAPAWMSGDPNGSLDRLRVG